MKKEVAEQIEMALTSNDWKTANELRQKVMLAAYLDTITVEEAVNICLPPYIEKK